MAADLITLQDADDIAAFYAEQTGMQPEMLQLSAGRLNLSFETADFGGLSIVWARAAGRTLWRDEQTAGTVQFGFVLESDASTNVRGREIGRSDAMLWIPGQEMEYVMRGPLSTLEIGVDEGLVAELGWQFDSEPLLRTTATRLHELAKVCRLAQDNVQHCDAVSEIYWRDRVLDALEPALEPWLAGDDWQDGWHTRGIRDYDVVRLADEYFERLGYTDTFSADDFVESIAASRRTVFHRFRRLLGIGPRRYFELRRLHVLKRRLRYADPGAETVTGIATELGFSDLGRMAARYRDLFAENPRQTLNRSA